MKNVEIVKKIAEVIGGGEIVKCLQIIQTKKCLKKEEVYSSFVMILEKYDNIQGIYGKSSYILRDRDNLVQRGVALFQSGAMSGYMQDMIDGLDFL